MRPAVALAPELEALAPAKPIFPPKARLPPFPADADAVPPALLLLLLLPPLPLVLLLLL